MASTLGGLRILDLTRGPAAGLATMILADFGAEVLRIEGPGDDPLATLPAAPMWMRNKHLLKLNLADPSQRETFDDLCSAADVFICNWRPSSLKKYSLDFTNLHEQHPHLIYCHVSAFGREGPMADCPGYEHTLAAYSGRMQMFQGIVDRQGPVFSALQVGVHACAQSATAGILAAVIARGESGLGRLIETSMLQGMLPYEQGPMLGIQWQERFPDLAAALATPPPEPPMPSLFYHPAQAGDGCWMQFGNLLPHLFDNFLISTDLIDIIADPDFNPRQLMMRTPEKQEAFRQRMLERIQAKTSQEWMATMMADGGVVATAYQTTQEALHDPDLVANGHVIDTPLGKQIGPLAKLTKTPAEPTRTLPDTSKIVQTWLENPQQTPSSAIDNTLPLTGIRVVEIATIIAAPLGASFLAEMGADVIKVEQLGGDPFRGMLSGIGAARVNAGKRSISVNMKTSEGQKLVLELLKDADVLIHNYRPGVPQRLGIDYEQVRAINPNIVYLQCNGYGPDGPSAQRPSTHPIPGAALGGVMYQMGEDLPTEQLSFEDLCKWTRRLMRANEVNPDPNTALVVTSSVLLGLASRAKNGEGQQIFIDMFGANAYANHDDFLDYPNKPTRALPDKLAHGLSATYRLYPCAEKQWVFLAIVTPKERDRFSTILNSLTIDPNSEFNHESPWNWRATDTELTATLGALFLGQTADWWQSKLVPAGLACVRADGHAPNEFWLQDPQCQAIGLGASATHPAWGEYTRHGAMVMFDGAQQPLGGPPLAGQHNQELLAELGYSATQVEQWREGGVVWQEV